MILIIPFLALIGQVNGHGHIVIPASTRHGGSIQLGGDCTNGACFWFSNNVEIPGKPTLPNQYRSVQFNLVEIAQMVLVSGLVIMLKFLGNLPFQISTEVFNSTWWRLHKWCLFLV